VGLDWTKYVRVDSDLVRPSESVPIIGNSAKVKRVLGRTPQVKFDATLRILLAHDLASLGQEVPFEKAEDAMIDPGPSAGREQA
jgi:hypothetical protein